MKKLHTFFNQIFMAILLLFIALPILKNTHFNAIQFSSENTPNMIHPQKIHAEELDSPDEGGTEFSPNTSNQHPQWNHNIMNIGQAWTDGYTGEGIKIAVLDTGFYIQHPDNGVIGGDSVFSEDPWSNDHSGHGTHIAGIISAKRGSPYQGIAPDAEVYGIKIYHEDDVSESGAVSTNVQSVIGGIQHAIDLDVDIIVISSGLGYHDPDLYDIIKKAHELDIMIIAASGNGHSSVNYPASYSEAIAVTAIDEQLNPALDIIYGQENDFSAPGVSIGGLSIPDSAYSYPYIFMSGSSQAAPHAAGLAAILMQKYNTRGEETRQTMREQALSIGDAGLYGHGLLQYVSDNDENNNELTPIESEPGPQQEVDANPSGNGDESQIDEAQKPVSSREADNGDQEDDDLVEFYQTDIVSSEALGSLESNILQLVENSGSLQINMKDMNSLYLNEGQISQIRDRNITIILAKENITWKTSAANFLPGGATLRFYEGTPVGVSQRESLSFGLHTISIFQETTRRDAYPSWMEITYNIESLGINDINALQSRRWDSIRERWVDVDSEIIGENIVLETRYTTAIGFFAPEPTDEGETSEVEEENAVTDEDNDSSSSLYEQIAFGAVIFIALLIGLRFFLKKKAKK